jgi:hydroxyacylglutathione hydrolase
MPTVGFELITVRTHREVTRHKCSICSNGVRLVARPVAPPQTDAIVRLDDAHLDPRRFARAEPADVRKRLSTAPPKTTQMERIEVETTEFEGQNTVYALGTESADALTLVDTGLREPLVRDQLSAGLARVGRSIEDVAHVFLTHYHEDHVGLAGDIQTESGATVHAPAGDAALIAGDPHAWRALRDTLNARFDTWGMPDAKRATVLDEMVTLRQDRSHAPTVDPFDEGVRFTFDWGTLETIDLPGHTDGHAGFVHRRPHGTDLSCGDALLPVYTPNVGGADVRTDDALATYIATLDRIAAAGYTRALPGHRHPIEDPTARALAIRDHHLDRTANVLDVLADGSPASVWEVSAALFGDLDGIHILHGPGEAGAHLEHLRTRGVVQRVEDRYRLLDAPADIDSLFE